MHRVSSNLNTLFSIVYLSICVINTLSIEHTQLMGVFQTAFCEGKVIIL